MTNETREKFIIWLFDKHMKYGDWFDEWWKGEGQTAFFAWAKAKGQEFMKVDPND